MAGETPLELVREFSAIRQVRPDIAKPVWHCSLSLPADERLSQDKWNEVVTAFMKSMGFSEYHPFVVVRHQDTEFDHVHIVASRVGLDGKVWLGQWEAHEAIKITQELENKFGLVVTKGYAEKNPNSKRNQHGFKGRKGAAKTKTTETNR
jgi:hypothetical protein